MIYAKLCDTLDHRPRRRTSRHTHTSVLMHRVGFTKQKFILVSHGVTIAYMLQFVLFVREKKLSVERSYVHVVLALNQTHLRINKAELANREARRVKPVWLKTGYSVTHLGGKRRE